MVAQVTQDSTAAFTEHYLHRDHLGGVEAISTQAGTLLNPPQALSFDAFGKRRDKDWNGTVASGDLTAARDVTHRGFTGHEMLDNLELVHMNGRVYDPTIGRFMSVDPVFQFPENTQSLNPYSYVLNNPLSLTDPSGFKTCGVGDPTSCLEDGLNTVDLGDGKTRQIYVGHDGEKVQFTDTKTGNTSNVTLRSGKSTVFANGGSKTTSFNPAKVATIASLAAAARAQATAGASAGGAAESGAAEGAEGLRALGARSLGILALIGSVLSIPGDTPKKDQEKIDVYRGTSRITEQLIQRETGLIMSEAAQQAYEESRGETDLARVREATTRAAMHHDELIAKYGSEKALAEAMSNGDVARSEYPRTTVSVTTNPAVARRFAGANGSVYRGQVPKSRLIQQPLSTSNESEYLVPIALEMSRQDE